MSDPNILPKLTKDEIDPRDEDIEERERNRELEENRPPHHEG
jgi:hypothetical protein